MVKCADCGMLAVHRTDGFLLAPKTTRTNGNDDAGCNGIYCALKKNDLMMPNVLLTKPGIKKLKRDGIEYSRYSLLPSKSFLQQQLVLSFTNLD